MDALKRFSIAAMATVLVAGLAPAEARDTRDTRPEPERPQIERNGGGDSSSTDIKIEPRLPKSSDGLSCVIDYEPGGSYAYAVNNSGKDIPAGTVVVWYAQPGNIQEYYQLNWDWKAGDILWIPVKDDDKVHEISFCAIKISTLRPKPEEPVGGHEPVRDQGGDNGPFNEPVPVPPEQEDFVPDPADFACWVEVDENGERTVHLKNISDTAYPPGTSIAVTFDNGKHYTKTWVGYFADGKSEVDSLSNEAYWGTPETCTVEVRIIED